MIGDVLAGRSLGYRIMRSVKFTSPQKNYLKRIKNKNYSKEPKVCQVFHYWDFFGDSIFATDVTYYTNTLTHTLTKVWAKTTVQLCIWNHLHLCRYTWGLPVHKINTTSAKLINRICVRSGINCVSEIMLVSWLSSCTMCSEELEYAVTANHA